MTHTFTEAGFLETDFQAVEKLKATVSIFSHPLTFTKYVTIEYKLISTNFAV